MYVVHYVAKQPNGRVVIDEVQSFRFVGDMTKFDRLLEDRAKKKGAFKVVKDIDLSN